jgi:hypothetical protein
MRRNADAGLRKLTAGKKRPTLSGIPAFAYYVSLSAASSKNVQNVYISTPAV